MRYGVNDDMGMYLLASVPLSIVKIWDRGLIESTKHSSIFPSLNVRLCRLTDTFVFYFDKAREIEIDCFAIQSWLHVEDNN